MTAKRITNTFAVVATAIVGLTIGSARAAIIGFEAESGTLGAEFDPAQADAGALGGSYITTESNGGGESPGTEARTVSYSLTVPAGTYDVYIRGRIGGGANDDSFFYAKAFGDADPTVTAEWQLMNGGFVPNGVFGWSSKLTATVTSPGGTVQWEIGAREDGFGIDAFALVTSGQTVTGTDLDYAVDPPAISIRFPSAENVSSNSATLSATLGFTNGTVTAIWDVGTVGDPAAHSGWEGADSGVEVSTGTVVRTASGLTFDTLYSYAFFATNAALGVSAWSDVGTFVTHLTEAQAPSFTAATPHPTFIELEWQNNASNLTGFVLQRSTNVVGAWTNIANLASFVTSHTDSGLSLLTTYHYRLSATNSANSSATTFAACQTNATTLAFPVGGPEEIYSAAGLYYYKVPAGVAGVTIKAWGAGGGGGGNDIVGDAQSGGDGGGGGYAGAVYYVTAGDVLKISVGAGGSAGGSPVFSHEAGGGGGLSSVENLSRSEVLIVAGGGGGGGGADEDDNAGAGGPGGGLMAGDGFAGDLAAAGDQGGAQGGGGGSTSSATGGVGGAVSGGGSAGADGASLSGGDGGVGRRPGTGGGAAGGSPGGGEGGGEADGESDEQNGGGGGGGGYYGGGGGGGADDNRGGGGGGGGSSYTGFGRGAVNTVGSSTNVANTIDSYYADNAGQGGRGRGDGFDSTAGNDGRIVILAGGAGLLFLIQ